MAKEKDPKRIAAYEIYKDYAGQITNREIARRLEVDEKKIATWKTRDNWTGKKKKTVVQQKNKKDTTGKKNVVLQDQTPNTTVEMKDLQKRKEFKELSERTQIFCYHYLRTYNAAASVRLAGFNTKYPEKYGHLLLRDERVKAFIEKIREEKKELLSNTMDDVIELLQRIAFSDVNDFLEVKNNRVVLKNSEQIDGQLVSEISETKDGAKIKLINKEKALEKLLEILQGKSANSGNKKLSDLLSEVDE